jgi:putative pyruvate formate lyase activating enzyme
VLKSELLVSCTLCPHKCGVNRYLKTGYCKTSDKPLVSSVFLHKGEEPVLAGEHGVCNVFFAHCNLQCTYCQNHQISCNSIADPTWVKSVEQVVSSIIPILDTGVRMLGFVSPSHQVISMLEIIEGLQKKGYRPTIIYNSNCYENVDTLKELENIVDIYLPDFKYINNDLGYKYSGVNNYFEIALRALKEMFRQKGTSLLIGNDELAEWGLIIRHLVLPGYSNESILLLKLLAEDFSSRLHLSIMSQYYPPDKLYLENPLNRILNSDEYQSVLNVFEEIGFRGWVQSMDSYNHYKPDFNSEKPFLF